MPGAYLWQQDPNNNAGSAPGDPTVDWHEGMAPSQVNNSARAEMASFAKWRDDLSGASVTTGSGTAYQLATAQVFTSYVDKAEIAFSPHVDNLVGPDTIAVDGLATKALRSAPGVELAAGTLKQGGSYRARYRAAGNEFILLDFYGVQIGAGGISTTMLADGAVTYAKMQNAAAQRLLGNPTGAPAAPTDIPIGGSLFFAGGTLSAGMARGGIDGLILSRSAATTLGIAAGACRSDDNTVDIVLAAAITKTFSAWAAGTGNGGLDTSAIPAASWLYVYAIYNPTTAASDVTFTTTYGSPTLQPGWTKQRYIGAFKTAASQMVSFIQHGDEFWWNAPFPDYTGTALSGLLAVSVPTGLSVQAIMSVGASSSGVTGLGVLALDGNIASMAFGNPEPASIWGQFQTASGPQATSIAGETRRWTNTLAQVRFNPSVANLFVTTFGWVDQRGRNS